MTARPDFPAAGLESLSVRRVAVIGAGSMGAGIAAHFANAGLAVDLLDMAGSGSAARNAPALAGIARQLKSGGFMDESLSGLVRPGNIEDDLPRLAEADWIIEAVIEDLAIKRDLYRRIDEVRKPGSIVSSNTSTIPRAALVEGMNEAFRASFVITHFFNPPRSMRLVELVSAPENPVDLVTRVTAACETMLGKTVVDCHDTPGFIANRIGCHWLAVAALEAFRLEVTPEEADTVMSLFGVPKTGAFGLLDLVGLDLVPHVWGSLMKMLPADDALHAFDLPANPAIWTLVANGWLGRKTKAGFYRQGADKKRETFDPATGAYRPERPVSPKDLPGGGRDLRALLASDDRLGRYAWSVLSHVVSYSASCGQEIAADAAAVDIAMGLGYAWKDGPFRLADRVGAADIVARLTTEKRPVPGLLDAAVARGGFFNADGKALRMDGQSHLQLTPVRKDLLATARAGSSRIAGNEAASLLDLGNDIACFEMHTKLNSFAPAVFDVLEETLARGGKDFRALVLGNNDPRAFSAGADLSFILGMIRAGEWQALEAYIERGQRLFLAMKYAAFPVVAAAHGFALGGGCEFMLHADAVIAHAELNAGLPETRVGLVPAWGGCTQLLLRAQQGKDGPRGPASTASTAFSAILPGATSTSARQAARFGLLRTWDSIAMNRDQLLGLATDHAASLADAGYQPPQPAMLVVTGISGKLGLMNGVHGQRAAGLLTDTDITIAKALAGVLTGGPEGDPSKPISEQAMMQFERQALLTLGQWQPTRDRIEHMLATGKPLRN